MAQPDPHSSPPTPSPHPGFGRRLLDRWQRRYARPEPDARAAVAHLTPTVVVTGGSHGIGLALARRFAKAGHTVALVARTLEPLQQAAAAIETDFGVKAFTVDLDVTEDDAPQSLDQRLAQHGLYTDILINCAGIGLSGQFAGQSEQSIEQLLNLNMAALTRLMRHALPGMRARARGGILNVASLGGLTPGPYQAAYYASKAYVISLSEAVGYETRGSGVRLSVLAPGPVDTQFHPAMGTEHAFYRQLILSLSAEEAASYAYRGYVLGLRLIVPGILNMFFAVALRIIPHTLMLPLVGWLLKPREERSWSVTNDNEQ